MYHSAWLKHVISGLRPPFGAGVLSAVASMVMFLALHHLWITPIWFVLPLGLALAVPGGIAVGWAHQHLAPRLPGGLWEVLAVYGLFSLVLLPSVLLAELRPPVVDVVGEDSQITISTAQLVVRFLLDLLLASTFTGWLAGYWIGKTRQAGLATAITGFVLALGPGHNIPFLGGTSATSKEIAMLAAMLLTAAVTLVLAQRLLSAIGRRAR